MVIRCLSSLLGVVSSGGGAVWPCRPARGHQLFIVLVDAVAVQAGAVAGDASALRLEYCQIPYGRRGRVQALLYLATQMSYLGQCPW